MKQRALVDRLYKEIESVILVRQHPVSGLLPASTAVNNHGDYTDAWVRDNVYSILSVWSLGLACRRIGDRERCDQLEQATIKLMRGLLISMMRQAAKVEKFKHSLNQLDSLHAKYDTATGLEVVADDAWGHLQVDATSIFLLMLAQMTASGLRIVTTYSEVDFVQNLVYYVASAYRTPDFGIWERGNKINNGKTEINASSVGMAKAALQALDGFNLFGKDASPRAVIHSVADAISQARNTLAALLPRESLSKETDAALLSIIGYPAFAVGDKTLINRTRDDILEKLGGNYGLKRFLWDGHQTAIEESSRLYYEHSELASFEHIESEWPLFFTYLYIHALFDGNESTARHYRQKLESLMVERNGIQLLPELYCVPKEHIEAEKQSPRSQPRSPNDNVPLVWAQSLYFLGVMLDEGLVGRDDLDPLRMRRRSRQLTKNNVALVVLAENNRVKQCLAQHGVIAETLDDILPLNALAAPDLVTIYGHVGANKALQLSGRPSRRLQGLATSQTYEINGKPFLSLSWMQSEHTDYRNFDAQLMAESIQREIAHLLSQWLNQEVAVFTWLVDESFLLATNAEALYATLRELQLRTEHEQVGYASANLAWRASRVNRFQIADVDSGFLNYKSLLPERAAEIDVDRLPEAARLLLESLEVETDLTCYRTLESFLVEQKLEARLGQDESSVTVRELVQSCYHRARVKGYWLLARFCYAVLGHSHMDLADGLTAVAARHLSVVVGKGKVNNLVIDEPMANSDLASAVNKLYHTPLERTLVQEVLAVIGSSMRTEPRLFDGLRSVRIQSLMTLAARASDTSTDMEINLTLGALTPAELMARVRHIFDSQHRLFTRGLNSAEALPKVSDLTAVRGVDTDWFEWRVARGSVTRLDDEFLKAIWLSMAQASSLILGDRSSQEFILDCELVRSSMTAGEVSFANHIDQLTQHLHPPYYKSAVIEVMHAFTEYCKGNPEARFTSPILLTQVLEHAAKSYIWDKGAAQLGKRDLDVLLEQSPKTLQKYALQVFSHIASSSRDVKQEGQQV